MRTKARAAGRLLRLSLAVSAVADVAAGLVLGAGVWPGGGAPWLLVLASLCVYHGGMALNDWADRAEDRRTRPGRPIPSGALAPATALAVAAGLLVLGPLLAWAVHPRTGLVAGAVALLAAAYDLGPRGPWLGPALLALCRAGNLALGIVAGPLLAAGGAELAAPLALRLGAPLAYGTYVLFVSRLGRLEDTERADLGRAPARLLAAAALALCAPLALAPLPLDLHVVAAAAVAGAGARAPLRRALAPGSWQPADVLAAMGLALRRLLVVTSVVALLVRTPAGLWVGLAILAGFPVSFALRRIFPPS